MSNNACKIVSLIVFIFIFSVLPVNVAEPAQTVFGNSGLVFIPTDEVAPFHTAKFGFSYIDSSRRLSEIGFGDSSHAGHFSFGFFPNMDAGLSVFEDASGETQFAAHTKIVLLPQLGDTQVSVTAGVWDAFGDHDFSPYVVVGKRIDIASRDGSFSGMELSLNLGYGGGVYGGGVFAGAGLKVPGGFEVMFDTAKDFANGGIAYRRGPFYAGTSFIDFEDALIFGGFEWGLE